jgi:nitrate/nitrite transporter NarK
MIHDRHGSPSANSTTVAAMRWRAAAGGFAPALSAGWNVANTGAVAVGLSHADGVSLGAVGLFTTALFLTHAALQVPAGRLCDRFGARVVGIAGLVVTAAASVVALTWRGGGYSAGVAGVAGALTLLLGIITRPLGGRIYGHEGLLRASFLLGGAGTAVLVGLSFSLSGDGRIGFAVVALWALAALSVPRGSLPATAALP